MIATWCFPSFSNRELHTNVGDQFFAEKRSKRINLFQRIVLPPSIPHSSISSLAAQFSQDSPNSIKPPMNIWRLNQKSLVNQTTWQGSSTSTMRAFSSAYKIHRGVNCPRRGGLLKNSPVRKVPSFLRTKQPTPTVTIFLEKCLKIFHGKDTKSNSTPTQQKNNLNQQIHKSGGQKWVTPKSRIFWRKGTATKMGNCCQNYIDDFQKKNIDKLSYFQDDQLFWVCKNAPGLNKIIF